MIIAIIVPSAIIIILLFLYLSTEIFMSKFYCRRGDGTLAIKYQNTPKEVSYENFSFKSNKEIIRGRKYFDKSLKSYKAVILLSHGIGFGHFYYMPLIELLAKDGYIIVAYDMSGSGLSTGKRVECMTQASIDIDYAMKYVTTDEKLKKYPLYLMGHSWGGFASLSALNYDYDIKKVVSIAGFNNEPSMAKGFFRILLGARNFLHFGKKSFYSGKRGLEKTNAKVLYIQGEKDMVVSLNSGANVFKKIKKDNIRIEVLPNKMHSPYIILEDEIKAMTLLGNLGMLGEKKAPIDLNISYNETAHLDIGVIKMILDFLDN